MQTREMQELLLAIMPQWHCYIAKPFKRLLDEGVSPEMYTCIRIVQESGGNITMSELARWMHMPKQQMTKLVDRLIDRQFVERVSDPDDRRIIRLRLTDRAQDYIDHFLEQETAYYRDLFDSMPQTDRDDFHRALETMHRVFCNLSHDDLSTERK